MTAKEKVLATWPDASAIQTVADAEHEPYWWIYCGNQLVGADEERLGQGETEEAAWQNAAESLPAAPEQETDEKDDAWKSMVESILPEPVAGVLSHEEHRRACMFNLPAVVFGSSPKVASVEANEKEPDWAKLDYAAKEHGCPCDKCAELKPTPSSPARLQRQRSIGKWCVAAFGDQEATSLPQRGIRLLEEAAEAAQAVGVDQSMAEQMVRYVWSRPAGALFQELGGIGVTTLALAEAALLDADECEAIEVERVLSKPLEHFTQRNQAKNDAGFLTKPQPDSSSIPDEMETDFVRDMRSYGAGEGDKHFGITRSEAKWIVENLKPARDSSYISTEQTFEEWLAKNKLRLRNDHFEGDRSEAMAHMFARAAWYDAKGQSNGR